MDVTLAGGKYNLTDIAAVIGLHQLPRLGEFTERRKALVKLYFKHFDRSLGCELPLEEYGRGCWHMFQVLLPEGTDRSAFIGCMRELGIGCGVHYPAMHLFTLFRAMGFEPGDFPVAERIGARTVTLPLFPAMRDEDVARACAAVGSALAGAAHISVKA
jgi:dTDP-4-amino-4,6-dideoxygalactose transaminase